MVLGFAESDRPNRPLWIRPWFVMLFCGNEAVRQGKLTWNVFKACQRNDDAQCDESVQKETAHRVFNNYTQNTDDTNSNFISVC